MKSKYIPVNRITDITCKGIMIARTAIDGRPNNEEVERSHRDSGYSFIVQEAGTMSIEIDFKRYRMKAPAIVFLHPDQVHRVVRFDRATICSWIVTLENIRPEVLAMLEEIAPVTPLPLSADAISVVSATASTCISLADREAEQLYDLILKESCNALIALVASQYLGRVKPVERLSRFEVVTRGFRHLLAEKFATVKSPAAYAKLLHISTPYLNECVKTVTGCSVSAVIQERVLLEAKRLLYHSHQSVKEIAGLLGYEDHSYFIRLFSKAVGMTPVAFREKNLE